MPTLHAFDSLSQSLDWQNESTIVLFGDDSFLKQRVLGMLTEDYESKVGFPATVFDGNVVEWRDVSDEVATVSLFGGDARRVAVVDNADRMITQYRDRLESYVTQESTTGCLVLLVNRWQANTRLYKSVDRVGLQIECRAPLAARKKELDEPRIVKWMMAWAKQQHQCEIDKAAAEELLGLVGSSLGMLDQDLAKLSLFVEPGEVIDVAKIQSVVGGCDKKRHGKFWTPEWMAMSQVRFPSWTICCRQERPRRQSLLSSAGPFEDLPKSPINTSVTFAIGRRSTCPRSSKPVGSGTGLQAVSSGTNRD